MASEQVYPTTTAESSTIDVQAHGGREGDHGDADRISLGDRLAVVSVVTWLISVALSGSESFSGVSGAVAILLAVVPIVRVGARTPVGWSAAVVGVFWVGYGALVGSLPSLGDPGAVADWATTEGRSLLPLLMIVTVWSIESTTGVERMLDMAMVVVAGALAVGMLAWLIDVDIHGFRISLGGQVIGLASSHHVAGFLGAGIAVLGLLRFATHRWSAGVVLIGVAAIAAAGSRSGLLVLVVAGFIIAMSLLPRHLRVMTLAASVVAIAVLAVSVPRFRQTIDVVTDRSFAQDSWSVLGSASVEEARLRSSSQVEANILLRLAQYGEGLSLIGRSPIVGIGAYRYNDTAVDWWGVEHIVSVAIDGDRNHSDHHLHNTALQLLAETGPLGLAIFLVPFVLVVRSAGRPRSSGLVIRQVGLGVQDVARAGPSTVRPVADRPVAEPVSDVDRYRVLTWAAIGAMVAVGFVDVGILTTGFGMMWAMLMTAGAKWRVVAARNGRAAEASAAAAPTVGHPPKIR